MKNLKKWSMNLVVLCVATMLFAGCGGGGGGSSTPAPTPRNLQFVNSSTLYEIDEVYAALSSSTSMGSKRNSSAIMPGTSWTLSGLTAGTYDASIISYGTVSNYWTVTFK